MHFRRRSALWSLVDDDDKVRALLDLTWFPTRCRMDRVLHTSDGEHLTLQNGWESCSNELTQRAFAFIQSLEKLGIALMNLHSDPDIFSTHKYTPGGVEMPSLNAHSTEIAEGGERVGRHQ